MGPWATPPPIQIGLRVDPARARPVPFCFQGLAPPPRTSALVFVPETEQNDAQGATVIEVTTEDEGRFGPPPISTPNGVDIDYVTISVTPINDPPELSGFVPVSADEEVSTQVQIPITTIDVADIDAIDPDRNRVRLTDGRELDYDILVIATGSRIVPEETEGLTAEALRTRLTEIQEGDPPTDE